VQWVAVERCGSAKWREEGFREKQADSSGPMRTHGAGFWGDCGGRSYRSRRLAMSPIRIFSLTDSGAVMSPSSGRGMKRFGETADGATCARRTLSRSERRKDGSRLKKRSGLLFPCVWYSVSDATRQAPAVSRSRTKNAGWKRNNMCENAINCCKGYPSEGETAEGQRARTAMPEGDS
jgi:hypothetical protein